MKVSLFRSILSLAVLCVVLTMSAVAQDLDDVGISGRVTDTNGEAIPGATVTAKLIQTGQSRSVTTNASGRYQLIELPPGTYTIRFEAQGFGAKERIDLVTLSGQNLQLDMSLSPADVQAEATVTVDDDDAPAVDTSRVVVGGTVSRIEIEELPNFDRNPLDLVLTLGGTAEESLSTSGLAEDRLQSPSSAPLEQGNFSLSGGTAYSNNITIDGLDNNDDRSSRDRFQPSLESIEEVQVITNQFSAEYGRASGGRVNIRTRAGNNRFRGRAFMFFRDARMNSNSWYNNSRNIARPAMTDINPGFSFSGPVKLPFYNGMNRTFFSATYEYDNYDDNTLIDAYIPLVQNSRFQLPEPTSNTPTCDANPPTSDNPVCAGPNPTAGFVVPYTKTYPTPNLSHIVIARVDHKLFKNNDLTVGWQFGRKKNLRTNGATQTRLDEAFQAKNINTDAINFTNNHVFGANVVNQLRGQWSRYAPNYQTAGPDEPVVIVSYRDPVTNSVRSLVAGNSTNSSSMAFADARTETRWQIQDSLTYVTNSGHTIKGGFDYQKVDSKTRGLQDASGTFNFNSVFNYSQNVVTRYRQNFGTASDVVNTYWGGFINDQFNVFSHTTLSLGVRYERETAVSDNNNWGPRLGIAMDPFKDGKGVIRFGAGIFYNRVLLRTVADSIQNANKDLISFDSNTIGTSAADPRRGPILAAIADRFPGTYGDISELRQLVSQACASIVTTFPCDQNTGFVTNVSSQGNPLRSVEADLKIPESYQFNIGFEREIVKGFVFEANYTWNKTVHLWRDYNPNAPNLDMANQMLGTNYADWTEYLINNPFQLSPTRQYVFFLGPTNDTTGHHANSPTGGNCGTTTAVCYVNLNTTNSTTTQPLVSVAGQNNNATGAPIGIALAAVAQFRPDSSVEETSRIGSNGNAFYQGLVLQLRRRYRQLGHGFGMSIRGAYTLSSTKDDGLNNTANAEVNGDFGREWTRNLQDRRHRLAITGVIETPRWFGKLRLSPVFRYGSSGRFNLGVGGSDRNLDDLGTDRVNFSGDIKDIVWREPGSPVPHDLISKFSLQPIGARSGNLPRNAGTSPSFYTFDVNITREIRFTERMRLRPFVEFNNIMNAAVFSFGSEYIDFTGLTAGDPQSQAEFLVPTRTYRQRHMRLGFRFDF
ncbi:MAG: carboxypeptidase regulatory-like domain-containing protein [Acidobacteria bacterium]|nr:carboxypeptidase regulatory-like domain-containing protein [Acidobacteriota bacterium]